MSNKQLLIFTFVVCVFTIYLGFTLSKLSQVSAPTDSAVILSQTSHYSHTIETYLGDTIGVATEGDDHLFIGEIELKNLSYDTFPLDTMKFGNTQ